MTTLTERFNRYLFHRAVRRVTATPPAQEGSNDFAALTMVHHRDVLPYLLAVKTFIHYASPARAVVIADPSLDSVDQDLLKKQIPFLEIFPASDFQRPALPVGGTWERLSAISVLCAETPIVQLDADTLTMAVPNEVIQAMSENRSFIIRSESGVEIQSLDATADYGTTLLKTSNHIQAHAEAKMTELSGWQDFRYARGCSGFTGFSRGAMTPERLDHVSSMMRDIHGPRWDDWGSEQVTSSLMAASAANAFLLPQPKYCNADALCSETVVSHFIGYARHINRNYENMALSEIVQLNKQGQSA